jgi:hypothetical protein
MESMFDKIKESIQQAGEMIKEQAASLGDAAKEKGYQLIEQWIVIIPKLEELGLKVNFFSVGLSINPTLEVELSGNPADFSPARIQHIISNNTTNTPMTLLFKTMLMTYAFHQKASLPVIPPLQVKISVRLSPEIKVSFGNQSIS